MAEKRGVLPRFFSGGEIPESYIQRQHMTPEEQQTPEGQLKRKELLTEALHERKTYLLERTKHPTEDEKGFIKKFLAPGYRLGTCRQVIKMASEYQRAKNAAKHAESPEEKKRWLNVFTEKKLKLDDYKAWGGPHLELQLMQYFEKVSELAEWDQKRYRIREINILLEGGGSHEIENVKKTQTEREGSSSSDYYARKVASNRIAMEETGRNSSHEELLSALEVLYEKDSEEYQKALEMITEAQTSQHKSVPELKKERKILQEEVDEIFQEDPTLRTLYTLRERNNLIRAVDRGEEVLEVQSTIEALNFLYDTEKNYGNTTIGGILVGPPGTGKTTLIKKYLSDLGRQYVQVDMSKEVSRFSAFGSKALATKGELESLMEMLSILKSMSDEELMSLAIKEREHNPDFISQMQNNLQELSKSVSEEENPNFKVEDTKIIEAVSKIFVQKISDAKVAEFSNKIHRIGKQNGWRYGFVVDALRHNKSIIFDEFNKMSDWSMYHSLLTAVPATDEEAGLSPEERFSSSAEQNKAAQEFDKLSRELNHLMVQREGVEEGSAEATHIDNLISQHQTFLSKNYKGWWYFADNSEWVRVPKDFKVYFTGNIGRAHKVEKVAPALASRIGGKVMEIGYKSPVEELLIMETFLTDNNIVFQRPNEDKSKVRLLIAYAIPMIRKIIDAEKKLATIPVSLRTIKDLCADLYDREKLVVHETTFEDAVWRHLVQPYVLYEEREIPKAICEVLLQHGFFLDNQKIIDQIIDSKWKTEEEIMSYKEDFKEQKEKMLKDAVNLSDMDYASPNDLIKR